MIPILIVSGFLGAGRMGITFKALDREQNDFVTLKVLRPEVVQDTATFERLKRAVGLALAE